MRVKRDPGESSSPASAAPAKPVKIEQSKQPASDPSLTSRQLEQLLVKNLQYEAIGQSMLNFAQVLRGVVACGRSVMEEDWVGRIAVVRRLMLESCRSSLELTFSLGLCTAAHTGLC